MKIIKLYSKEFEKLCNRYNNRKKRVADSVTKIVEDVRLNGDDAVIKYTRKFDKVKLSPRQLKVTESEASGAFQDIDSEFIAELKNIIDNVTKFYKKQVKNRKSWRIVDEDGVVLGEKYEPIEKVGIYVPAGTAPLISTVYMTVIPARVAGVKSIVLCTPPNKYESVDPYILAVANLLKVDEIYKVGGAQAIAALAFGTKTIPKVDKIVGPGNDYVTEAKRQVFGYADIDMIAGPSEVVILANRSTNPIFAMKDLEAQSEHFKGLPILVTTSKPLAKTLKKEVANGYIIIAKNLDEACDVVNRLAPEHLQIMVKNPQKWLKKIKNAGAIFLGQYSPTAIGDYVAGPSHVLPTSGTARFFSGLGVEDFVKSSHIISYSKKALEKAKKSIEKISKLEGLNKHMESIKVRF
ncbi:MAG: histidinol dehydrogenase [Omnitrophica WOR_2 bacterium RIFCSPLOWO2_12_FULL_51_24]|nr:MAG: histidinol dehydrogenase [Omnitrophica WOR_2 bacterium RIFCSPHIGHO2_01_FULL_49_10]OGX35947.1 MAG: histidinol dehydrogenase [Omnitrophica WOR_2 bacterium RIFCSPLOWO2_02_FULL_50_19]OGX43389.1 MAG: histidinol dehydrogenase [Omnitrophica WOR_2 bacterium RIFCSPLOWO2_12_FULL_51_24]